MAKDDLSTIIQEPSKSLRVYAIFKDNELLNVDYLEEPEVPHTNEEFLEFKSRHNIGNTGNFILLNCEGEFSGITMKAKCKQSDASRITSYKETITSPTLVRKFVLQHGGDKHWRIKDYLKETKDWSDPIFTKSEKPLSDKVKRNQQISKDTYSGGNPYGPQILSH